MKKCLLRAIFALLVGCCISLQTFAQAITVTGKVTAPTGEALPGVSILVKGTNSGTTTDGNGAYTLSASSANATFIFSAIGFLTEEHPIGNKSVLNITLKEDNKLLNEVVVTALGIKREEKSLGFAAQTINENAVKDAKSNNWVNTLSGKVAGLNIQEQAQDRWVLPALPCGANVAEPG